jgi:hypothetical protein
MKLDQETIREAFRMHGEVYAVAKNWDTPYHIKCWGYGRAAFDSASLDDFERLYRELKNRWQVFRRANGEPWTPTEAFERLRSLPSDWRGRRLSQLTDDGLAGCWDIIDSIKDIKPMKSAPSVMAVSKFLHFWNPRLFVIVDDGVVMQWVFRHRWLKRPIEEMRERILTLLPHLHCPNAAPACDLLSYLAVVRWSADVIRANPNIAQLFVEHVQASANGAAIDLPLDTYEAAAMEWLLLGLVELLPQGVTTLPIVHGGQAASV